MFFKCDNVIFEVKDLFRNDVVMYSIELGIYLIYLIYKVYMYLKRWMKYVLFKNI